MFMQHLAYRIEALALALVLDFMGEYLRYFLLEGRGPSSRAGASCMPSPRSSNLPFYAELRMCFVFLTDVIRVTDSMKWLMGWPLVESQLAHGFRYHVPGTRPEAPKGPQDRRKLSCGSAEDEKLWYMW